MNKKELYEYKDLVKEINTIKSLMSSHSISKKKELEVIYKDLINKHNDKLLEIETFINEIDESNIREIFRRRFILLERWEKIARATGNSERTCRRKVERYLKK